MGLLEFLRNAPEKSSFKIEKIEGYGQGIMIIRNCSTGEKCAIPPEGYEIVNTSKTVKAEGK